MGSDILQLLTSLGAVRLRPMPIRCQKGETSRINFANRNDTAALYNMVVKECERTNVVPPSLSECDLLGNTPRWKNVRDKKDPLTAHLGPCDMHDYAEIFVSMMTKHFHAEYKSGHAVGGVGSSSSGHADVFDIRRANPNTNRGGHRTAGKRHDPAGNACKSRRPNTTVNNGRAVGMWQRSAWQRPQCTHGGGTSKSIDC